MPCLELYKLRSCLLRSLPLIQDARTDAGAADSRHHGCPGVAKPAACRAATTHHILYALPRHNPGTACHHFFSAAPCAIGFGRRAVISAMLDVMRSSSIVS